MNADYLLRAFRRDTGDVEEPYLWANEEVLVYMDDAYKMFVRLTGGVADCTSPLCTLDVVAGENTAEIDTRILRIMRAVRASDNELVEIINATDLTKMSREDYGLIKPLYMDKVPGPVRYMVIGRQRGLVQWVQVPEADDQVLLDVYRLPLTSVKPDGSNLTFNFPDIGEEHHYYLLKWMFHRGYDKRDSDLFDPVKAEKFKAEFISYCDMAKAEWERSKHKTRVVNYEGI